MPPVLTGGRRGCRCAWLRIIDIPPEVLSLLRYGRGVDTVAFVDAGFDYRLTTLRRRSRRSRRRAGWSGSSARHRAYEYEHDVEDVLPALTRGRATRR